MQGTAIPSLRGKNKSGDVIYSLIITISADQQIFLWKYEKQFVILEIFITHYKYANAILNGKIVLRDT